MADRDFTLPIGHDANNLSTVEMQIGKTFLQPVNIVNYDTTYSTGLEIWIPNEEEDRKLYSSFNGIVKYVASNGDDDFNKIELTISDRTISVINLINGLLEPTPKKFIYKNVNDDSMSEALEALINTEYNAALINNNAPNWHPIMRINYNNQRIKDYLDNNSTSLGLAITAIIDNFRDGDIPLVLNCGDYFGDADTYSNLVDDIHEDVIYSNPRLLLLEIEEYAENKLNPKYYFWRLLKNAFHTNQNSRKVNLITQTTLNNATNQFDHPFLIAIDIDVDENVNARAAISYTLPGQQEETDEVLLFPLGKLEKWQGTDISNNDPSDLEWRINDDDDLDFEIRRRPNTTSPNVRLCGETTGTFNACVDINSNTIPQATRTAINDRVGDIWDNFEDDIIDVCEKLQIPSEIIVSILGHESKGVERAIRYEPLSDTDINNLYENINIENSIVDAYVALTTSNYLIPAIPTDTADWNNEIQPLASTLTWNQARQVVSILPHKCSPGIMQTLIETATTKFNWLNLCFDNVADEFGIDAFPNNNAERHDWLLTARHSILVGAATIKYGYCNYGTGYNLLKIYSTYNAGSRRHLPIYQNNYWGLRFYGVDYPIDAGRHYNAFQNDTGDDTECRVRFWRNLE